MAETMLQVRGAQKKYGDHQALKGVDLDLYRGEWLALLGPNGAGKTTLIRSIAGRVRLDQGDMTLLGNNLPVGSASGRERLGIVPQEIALYKELTGLENLRIFGKLQGLTNPELEERVAWALDWVGLTDRASEQVKGYSGGMQRRLNIAAAVLHKPDVLLLDEPTVGVDPQSRQRIWEMLDQLRREGASLLLTTHNLVEAQEICDRIVIIDHGKAIANGSLEQLISDTIGPQRTVIFHLEGRKEEIRRGVDDVAGELPGLIEEICRDGSVIRDLQIEAPSLQAVFIHLTGRELRE